MTPFIVENPPFSQKGGSFIFHKFHSDQLSKLEDRKSTLA